MVITVLEMENLGPGSRGSIVHYIGWHYESKSLSLSLSLSFWGHYGKWSGKWPKRMSVKETGRRNTRRGEGVESLISAVISRQTGATDASRGRQFHNHQLSRLAISCRRTAALRTKENVPWTWMGNNSGSNPGRWHWYQRPSTVVRKRERWEWWMG